MVGKERATLIVENRPFQDWEDLREIEVFSDGMIDDLKSGVVELGIHKISKAFPSVVKK